MRVINRQRALKASWIMAMVLVGRPLAAQELAVVPGATGSGAWVTAAMPQPGVGDTLVVPQIATASPALRLYWPQASRSHLAIEALSAPEAADRIVQLGNGGRAIRAQAVTSQQLSDHDGVWGQASYTNGSRYNVRWSETSDFLSLYPYVMGDPRGGDTKYEQYELLGGYSRREHHLSYGLELGYRALSEYRSHDPRPNNTVADLQGKIGVGYALGGGHVAALSLSGGRYKQTSELVYLNELGAQKEYHLTGVGNDFARFSGASNNTFYKGNDVGLTADYRWQMATAGLFTASAGYGYSYREKVLTDLNRLPLNELRTNTLHGDLSYTLHQYSVVAGIQHRSRKGRDNLFGDATGNVYPQIGFREQYEGNETALSLKASGRWQWTPRWQLVAWPAMSYVSMEGNHLDSDNHMGIENLYYGAALRLQWQHGNNTVGLATTCQQRSNLSHKLRLDGGTAEPTLGEALYQADRYFAEGETTLRFGLDYTRTLSGAKAITVELGWTHGSYLDSQTCNEYRMGIAVTL